MQHLRYGTARRTWAGDYRDEIQSRQRPAYVRPTLYLGRLLLDLPGCRIDWTLHQDSRDLRRFRAVDLDGIQHEHCAPREMMRRLATVVPMYSARVG